MLCQALRNVPESKLNIELSQIDSEFDDLEKRAAIKKAFHRYYEANIPIKYWRLDMRKHFTGDANILAYYEEMVSDIPSLYRKGTSICFAGNHGLGKTMVSTNVLKRALEKGYSGLYVNLTDIISIMKTYDSFAARKDLIQTDFLVVDEFDPRYMPTESASDFYGRVFEDILRNRSQNKLPIILCSNSPNPVEAFKGSIKEGISSLWNYVDLVPVFGKDFRAQQK